ncbi:MAG: 50S ribosomal protein L13 [Bdellovibrionia bacterium]
MKTFNAKADEVERQWWVIDAADQRVGRVATTVANILRGKNKPIFTPNVDTGDFVVVINTDKMQLTGSKWSTKKYYRHSRFFGSMKEKTAAEKLQEDSAFIMEEAVRGMLPTNKLSRDILAKLKAYPGAEHPHAAQKPQAYTLK